MKYSFFSLIVVLSVGTAFAGPNPNNESELSAPKKEEIFSKKPPLSRSKTFSGADSEKKNPQLVNIINTDAPSARLWRSQSLPVLPVRRFSMPQYKLYCKSCADKQKIDPRKVLLDNMRRKSLDPSKLLSVQSYHKMTSVIS